MSNVLKEILTILRENIFSSVGESISLRLKSAFFGSFIISWIVWNWDRVAYFILSKDLILPRIKFIKESDVFNKNFFNFDVSGSFWVPLALAVLFTFSYPFFIYAISIIHKFILNKIDIFQLDKSVEYTKNQIELVRQKEESEGEREKIKARVAREVAFDKEREAISNTRVNELIAQRANLLSDCTKIKDETESLETILKKQMERKTELTDQISGFNIELAPLRQEYDKYMKMIDENNELKTKIQHSTSEKENLRITIETLEYEVQQLRKDSSDKTEKILTSNSSRANAIKMISEIEEIFAKSPDEIKIIGDHPEIKIKLHSLKNIVGYDLIV